MADMLEIPISKGGNKTIPVDVNSLPEDIFALVVKEGLKVLLNAKMSKITTAKLEGEALASAQSAAMEQGLKNLADLMEGKATKRSRETAKADGISREVMTEAMRLAKAVVKDELRENGIRPSMVAAKDITAAAKDMVAADPSFVEQAKRNIEGRQTIKPKVAITIKEDPKLVKLADEKKAVAKAERQLSKTQAGKVAPRKAKPGKEAPAAH